MAASRDVVSSIIEICNFLRSREVDETVIDNFRRERMDADAVLNSSTIDMKKMGLTAAGDISSLQQYARKLNRVSEKKALLQTFLNNGGNVSRKRSRSLVDTATEKKTKRKVYLGWAHFNEHTKSFVAVRSNKGGGAREVELDLSTTATEVIETAKKLFFPNGTSRFGTVETMNLGIADSQYRDLRNVLVGDLKLPFSLQRYAEGTKLSRLRINLTSKKKKWTEMCEVSEGEQGSEDCRESDIELPSTPVVDFIELEAESERTSKEIIDDSGTCKLDKMSEASNLDNLKERRILVSQQDKEYQESLKADKAKEEKKRAELLAQLWEAERLEQLKSTRSKRVPPVPQGQDSIPVQVRHMTLGLIKRSFGKGDKVTSVYDWVGSQSLLPENFVLEDCAHNLVKPSLYVEEVTSVLYMKESACMPLEDDEEIINDKRANRAKNKDEESASSSDYGKAFNGSPVVADYSSLLYVDSDNVSDVSVNQEEECDELCHENDNEMDEKGSFSNETISCNTSLRNRLNEILSEVARVIDSTAISKFNIARNFIWEGTKRGLGRKSFLPRNKISVKFSDDAGTSEGAVDQGGPMREFFSLVIQWMVNSQLFCGPEGKKMLTCQRKCLEEREYFYAGEILAMSLVHGGPGPECLSPTLFEALIKDDISKIAVPLDDVCDQELRSSLEDLLHTTTKDEADTIVYNSSLVTVMELAGTLEPIQTGKIEMMVNATAKWYVLGRIQPALESFKGGMCTLGVLDAVKRNPDAFRSTICYSPVKLTGQVFEEIFTVINSPVGSSRAVTESLVLSRWQDYVQDVEEEEEHPTLADILFFVIACRTLPPRKVSPEIQFLHEPEDWKEPELSRFPKANTCSQTLFLPVVYKSYEDFKADMTFGFLNGQGFGIA